MLPDYLSVSFDYGLRDFHVIHDRRHKPFEVFLSIEDLFANIHIKGYGAHSVPKPFNKLTHLANEINQFSVFLKMTL